MASIKQRKDSYLITVSCGYDVFGKKLYQTATYKPPEGLTPKKKEKAVADFAHDFETKVLNGYAMEGRHITLKDFSDHWLREYASANLERRTISAYTAELNSKILPALGHYKLSDLRPHIINGFLSSLRSPDARKDGKGAYSKGSIRKVFAVISSILETATKWEVIQDNPCRKVTIPTAPETADNIKFFSPEQASLFLNYLENPQTIPVKGHARIDDTGKPYTVADYEKTGEITLQFRVLYNLAIFSGMRKGELLALQWDDIDWDESKISVTKSAGVADNEPIIKAPKTRNSIRTVTLPESVMALLREYYKEQTRTRLALGDYWKNEGWLFTQLNGTRMDYSTPAHHFRNTLKRYNQTASKANQLPLIPFHGLRHTSATILIAGKQDVRSVSARLGHSQTSTTMNVYAHALRESDQKCAAAIENMLRKKA